MGMGTKIGCYSVFILDMGNCAIHAKIFLDRADFAK